MLTATNTCHARPLPTRQVGGQAKQDGQRASNLFVKTMKVVVQDRVYQVPAYHLLTSPVIRDGLRTAQGDHNEQWIDLSFHTKKEHFENLIEALHPSTFTFDLSPRGTLWISVLKLATRLEMKPVRATAIEAILSGAVADMDSVEKVLLGRSLAISSLFRQGCQELILRPETPTFSELTKLQGGMGWRIMLLREERLHLEFMYATGPTVRSSGKDFNATTRMKETFADLLREIEERSRQFGDESSHDSGVPNGHGSIKSIGDGSCPQGSDRSNGRGIKRLRSN